MAHAKRHLDELLKLPPEERSAAAEELLVSLEGDVDDEDDQLDQSEREALNAAITRSLKESESGRTAPAEEIINRLRERRGR